MWWKLSVLFNYLKIPLGTKCKKKYSLAILFLNCPLPQKQNKYNISAAHLHSKNHFHHRNQRLLIKNHNKTSEEYFTRNYNNNHNSVFIDQFSSNTKEEVPSYETKILLCYYFDITASILKFEGRNADKNALRMKVEIFLGKIKFSLNTLRLNESFS